MNQPLWPRQHLLFASFDDGQFRQVAHVMAEVRLADGEHLFRQQDPARYFYLLTAGQIKLYRLSANGEEKVIELIAAGQSFAEAVMFMDFGVYPVNAQALGDCALLRVDMAAYRTLLGQSPETCLRLLGHMSQRLHQSIREIGQLTLQNATMRIVQFLLNALPASVSAPHHIQWETPKSVLASRLSVRPETFSRILQQLSQERLIRVHGKTVEILDTEALRQRLEK
jgi:CRP-like cAMP-binding protein